MNLKVDRLKKLLGAKEPLKNFSQIEKDNMVKAAGIERCFHSSSSQSPALSFCSASSFSRISLSRSRVH
jgi:hypothetical protein